MNKLLASPLNKFLASPLAICILVLTACSPKTEQTINEISELEVIDVLFCAEKNRLSLNVDEIYETEYPWIFNKESGKLYERDIDKNELYPLEVFFIGESKFVYESKLNGNILEIKETEYYPVNEKIYGKYLIDLDQLKSKASFRHSDGYKEKYNDDCISIPLPDGITIRKKKS